MPSSLQSNPVPVCSFCVGVNDVELITVVLTCVICFDQVTKLSPEGAINTAYLRSLADGRGFPNELITDNSLAYAKHAIIRNKQHYVCSEYTLQG